MILKSGREPGGLDNAINSSPVAYLVVSEQKSESSLAVGNKAAGLREPGCGGGGADR